MPGVAAGTAEHSTSDEKSSLAARSRELFTLSAFYNACADLVDGLAIGDLEQDADLARWFWESAAESIPEWSNVIAGNMLASEVRQDYIHSHGIALQALGTAGNALIKARPTDWRDRLRTVGTMDWSRKNTALWEGRALSSGRVVKGNNNVILTCNAVKQALGLPLAEDQQRVDDTFHSNSAIRGPVSARVPGRVGAAA